MKRYTPSFGTAKAFLISGLAVLGAALLVALITFGLALAKDQHKTDLQSSPIHPAIELLDAEGQNVLTSGAALSTMQTCGTCHDTEFIASHSYHASAGLESYSAPGTVPDGRAWDTSQGIFGRWNPLAYRTLTAVGENPVDLTTPDWVRLFGDRHVGGGPAATSRSGQPLDTLVPDASNPETAAVDMQTGELQAWDWTESGVVEMDCFLCHIPQPDLEARTNALQEGEFAWSAAATLANTGIVEITANGYRYNPAVFDEDGQLPQESLNIQDPTNENCGACHGIVHTSTETPLVAASCNTGDWRTDTTGQVISPQRIKDSGINLADKETLSRSWDIHAERVVGCTDCHYALNNPVYFQNDPEAQPEHLAFDPRRLELGDYLYQPLHQFARGSSAQNNLAPELQDTMRSCESCHSIENTHNWLPYKTQHTAELSCESCHIPELYYSALEQVDWTTITPNRNPLLSYRGTDSCSDVLLASSQQTENALQMVSSSKLQGQVNNLITGYQPILLPHLDQDGNQKLAPYNLVTAWFWVAGDPPRPVTEAALAAAWMEAGDYAAEVVNVFDANQDGRLSSSELVIDQAVKEQLIASRLQAQGLDNPRIQAEIQPYSINHNVTHGEWAVKDCRACHSEESRLGTPLQLASYVPGGRLPEFVQDTNVVANGDLQILEDGSLIYQPDIAASDLYIFGKNRVAWIDLLGSLAFVGVLLGISVHGGLRFAASLRMPHDTPRTRQVYMYTVYERLWHWLQTFTILMLLFTGLIIHRPDTFGIFSFRYVVLVHNILAAVLLINAFLALFYHLASGEIKQYIPRTGGFFDQAIEQAVFYTRGIFKGEHHPFEKTPEKKLNPLQQITYFGILNVLLPLQVITGILMWGVQQFPGMTDRLGGLQFLAPFHSLVAWLFAAFIVAHVYLTTTGPQPASGIKAMMMGWEDVEVLDKQEAHEEQVSANEPAAQEETQEESSHDNNDRNQIQDE